MTPSSFNSHQGIRVNPTAALSPRDCGLAIAVPLERDDFLAQLEPTSPHEFAKWYHLRQGSDLLPETLWANAYGPHEATPMSRVADECARMGVEVVTRCTLGAFADLAATKPVVIIAAHWRCGILQASDVRDLPRFLVRLRTERRGVLQSLRTKLLARHGEARPADDLLCPVDAEGVARLFSAIERVMSSGPIVPSAHALPEATSDASYYLAINRERLHEDCGDEFNAGMGLEMANGTYAAHLVGEALGGGFAGLIDMAVCNSYLLAENVKRQNPDCLILANRDTVTPTTRLLIARETIRSIHRKPASYLTVALAIRDRLTSSRGRR
jgi:hypothetical protein